MKKRMGFVSNSSSSSFCILGVTSDEIEEQIDVNTLSEEFDWYYFSSKDIQVRSGISDYYESYVIGVSPSSLDENLTIVQNKEVVAEKINKVFGTTFTKDDIGFMVDEGYNG